MDRSHLLSFSPPELFLLLLLLLHVQPSVPSRFVRLRRSPSSTELDSTTTDSYSAFPSVVLFCLSLPLAHSLSSPDVVRRRGASERGEMKGGKGIPCCRAMASHCSTSLASAAASVVTVAACATVMCDLYDPLLHDLLCLPPLLLCHSRSRARAALSFPFDLLPVSFLLHNRLALSQRLAHAARHTYTDRPTFHC